MLAKGVFQANRFQFVTPTFLPYTFQTMTAMKTNQIKKSLLRTVFAKTSIDSAVKACDFVIANVQTADNPVYYSLVTAIFVLYARPFGENNGAGKIPSKYALYDSPEKRNLHDMLIHGRNKFYAHVDANTKYYDENQKPVGCLFQLSIMVNDMKDGTVELSPQTIEPQLTLETIPRIKSLSAELLKKLCDEEKLLLQLLVDAGHEFKLGRNMMVLE